MGRFDALTSLDEQMPTPPEVQSPPPLKTETIPSPAPMQEEQKPDNLKSGNHEKHQSLSPLTANKPEKYSTLLKPELIKMIKVRATEMDLKDYQLIEIALEEYFQHHK